MIVWCPESKGAAATQQPIRGKLPGAPEPIFHKPRLEKKPPEKEEAVAAPLSLQAEAPKEDHYTILYGDMGYSYEAIFGKYLQGCTIISIEDPYIRSQHQIQNLVRFCELAVKIGSVKEINLLTGFDNDMQKADALEKFELLQDSLKQQWIDFKWKFSPVIHDRKVVFDNGWTIKIGRGLDIYQKPENWFSIGSNDFHLRPCLETMVDIYKDDSTRQISKK